MSPTYWRYSGGHRTYAAQSVRNMARRDILKSCDLGLGWSQKSLTNSEGFGFFDHIGTFENMPIS
ncbi:hypothetical protein AIOL_004672 [Candidatus Rhodobacter oscarellae]|uniref:Uncharacterized protein n=1 Tax=Candidatus Rhodobacter oscarellae TaxID=1675527 RepID=A0A0J9EA84_9RHOB|nr:hypothetical protein AIOL_004672 [Candidatus Rhodobacter lobularis]